MRDQVFALLRYAVLHDKTLDAEAVKADIDGIYKLAKKHDLGQMIALSAEETGISNAVLSKEKALAVFRTEKLKFVTAQICEVLENVGIPYMLLKGAQIRKLYPEEWLRTSCDVDVFVDPCNLEKATAALEAAGFIKGRTGDHDIAFTAPNSCHVELHFILIEDQWLENSGKIFSDPWSSSIKETEHRYRMTDEMLYFYHLAHMAKHIKNGGCGIKAFIDLLLMDKNGFSTQGRELCKKYGLGKFEESALSLSKVWFADGKHNEITRALEEFIVSGNVYGSSQNRITVNQRNSGNKFKYLLSRMFMPYSELKKKYPSLDGKPLLFPIYTLRRCASVLKCNVYRRVKKEMSIDKAQIGSVDSLFRNLEL